MLPTLVVGYGRSQCMFQWAPTLGGECYWRRLTPDCLLQHSFNGHPPLGVNATSYYGSVGVSCQSSFNGHPPLGVNATSYYGSVGVSCQSSFNGHPPLGVNATQAKVLDLLLSLRGFNGHPPLGVNATSGLLAGATTLQSFQWAPTLGGECYPLEVSALEFASRVSMGTHPWG